MTRVTITARSPLELVGDLVHVNTGKGLWGGCLLANWVGQVTGHNGIHIPKP